MLTLRELISFAWQSSRSKWQSTSCSGCSPSILMDWAEIIGGGIEQGKLEQTPDMYFFFGRGYGGYLDFALQLDDFVDVRLGVGHIDVFFQRYLYVSPADNIL